MRNAVHVPAAISFAGLPILFAGLAILFAGFPMPAANAVRRSTQRELDSCSYVIELAAYYLFGSCVSAADAQEWVPPNMEAL